jgi:hypothetical protein
LIVALDRPAITNATITRADASRTSVACIRIGLPDRGEQRGDSSPQPPRQRAASHPEAGKESRIKEEGTNLIGHSDHSGR